MPRDPETDEASARVPEWDLAADDGETRLIRPPPPPPRMHAVPSSTRVFARPPPARRLRHTHPRLDTMERAEKKRARGR